MAETIELPMGHQAKLYEMAANAHYQRENWDFAEKYFLIDTRVRNTFFFVSIEPLKFLVAAFKYLYTRNMSNPLVAINRYVQAGIGKGCIFIYKTKILTV